MKAANETKALWKVLDLLRGTSSCRMSDTVVGLSQLCVLALLAHRYNSLASMIESGTATLQAIRTKAQDLIHQEHGESDPSSTTGSIGEPDQREALTEFDSSFWNSVSPELLRAALSTLVKEVEEPEIWVKNLIAMYRKDKYAEGLGVPHTVFQFMAELLDEDPLDLSHGEGALLFGLLDRSRQLTLRVVMPLHFRFISALLYLEGRKARLQLIDSMAELPPKDSGSCLSIPVINAKLNQPDAQWFEEVSHGKLKRITTDQAEIVKQVQSGIHSAILVPASILHSFAARSFRQWLVDTGALNAIVEFPSRLLTSVDLPFAVLELNRPGRHMKNDIMMIDATPYLEQARAGRYELHDWKKLANDLTSFFETKHACLLTPVGLEESDYDLSPRRFLGGEQDALHVLLTNSNNAIAELGDIAKIIRPSPLTLSKKELAPGMKLVEVLISDIDADGVVRSGSKARAIPEELADRIDKFRLRPGDVVIGTKGSVGKAGIVDNHIDENLICGQTMVILRLEKNSPIIAPEYLYRYLATKQVLDFLQSRAAGATIKFIKANDLAKLPVPIRTAEEQQAMVSLHQQILDKLQSANTLRQEAIRMAAHAFDQAS